MSRNYESALGFTYVPAFIMQHDSILPVFWFSGNCPSVGSSSVKSGLHTKYSIKNGIGSPVFLLYAVKECHHQP